MKLQRAAIALGSNLGDRLGNLLAAVRALDAAGARVAALSRLYESAPAYVTDQPAFLNAAALVETRLPPAELLAALKAAERALGRGPGGARWGPRPIDLDIIFYEDADVVLDGLGGGGGGGERHLVVPHPRWQERDFVKAPLADLAPAPRGGGGPLPAGLDRRLAAAARLWDADGGDARLGSAGSPLAAVLPMGRLGPWAWTGRTRVMGVLNVTPDSFSDGGRHFSAADARGSVAAAAAHAAAMAAEGADIIDVGGQSTRPGAELVPPAAEAARVLPVLRALREHPATAALPLSVDTFYAEVAAAAVAAGATAVNDVSGGAMDPGGAMLETVAELGVPYVLMHMRGTPATMQRPENLEYRDVVADVAAELAARAAAAVAAGVQPWRLVLDPGLGFAKDAAANLALVAGLPRLREALGAPLRRAPLLVGPSRKRFLGAAVGREGGPPEGRDAATAAAAALCAGAGGAAIVRAHAVAAVRDAVAVADAVAAAGRRAPDG